MIKLKVKQEFNDWVDGVRRLPNMVFEVTDKRYKELTKNLVNQGIKVEDVVEIINDSSKN